MLSHSAPTLVTAKPPVFSDLDAATLVALESDAGDVLREEGAALAAYGRLQFKQLATRTLASSAEPTFV